MKFIVFLCCLFCFTTVSARQSPAANYTRWKGFTRNLQRDLRMLLPYDTLEASIKDRIGETARLSKWRSRVQDSMIKYNMFEQDSSAMMVVLGMKYDPRLGITKEEYKEYGSVLMGAEGREYKTTAVGEMKVRFTDSLIYFKSLHPDLMIFDSIVINFKKNLVRIKGRELTPADTVCLPNEKNLYTSPLRGYKWTFTDPPQGISMPFWQKEGNGQQNLIYYEFLIGFLSKYDETLMEVTLREMKNGKNIRVKKLPVMTSVMY
jgi:hypothetical protein